MYCVLRQPPAANLAKQQKKILLDMVGEGLAKCEPQVLR
jgi:hypothetical protein